MGGGRVMQWPGITPARLYNAVAPQEGSRPFGPQGTPSDDFLPRCAWAPAFLLFACLWLPRRTASGDALPITTLGTDDSRRPPMQARYVSHSACYRFPAGARQELSSVTPDRLQLMVMALPAPRAVRLSQTWGSGLAGSGGVQPFQFLLHQSHMYSAARKAQRIRTSGPVSMACSEAAGVASSE